MKKPEVLILLAQKQEAVTRLNLELRAGRSKNTGALKHYRQELARLATSLKEVELHETT